MKPHPPVDLDVVRAELNVLDDHILDLVLARFARLERVAQIKSREALPGYDAAREQAIFERIEAKLSHLDPKARQDVLEVFHALIGQGRLHVQRRVSEIVLARDDARDEQQQGMDPGA